MAMSGLCFPAAGHRAKLPCKLYKEHLSFSTFKHVPQTRALPQQERTCRSSRVIDAAAVERQPAKQPACYASLLVVHQQTPCAARSADRAASPVQTLQRASQQRRLTCCNTRPYLDLCLHMALAINPSGYAHLLLGIPRRRFGTVPRFVPAGTCLRIIGLSKDLVSQHPPVQSCSG